MLATGTSFINANTNEEKFEISPECFDFADRVLADLDYSYTSHASRHSFWEAQYDYCEANTDYDEFQYPS